MAPTFARRIHTIGSITLRGLTAVPGGHGVPPLSSALGISPIEMVSRDVSDGGKMAGAIHLEHVGIRTAAETFEGTIGFYTDLLGWRVIEERPSTGPDDRVTFIADGQGGAFEVFVGSGGPIEDPAHLAFAVPFDEFPTLAQRLAGAGVTFDEPFINDVGDQIAFFNDPAGNRAQIVGRLKPLPSRDA